MGTAEWKLGELPRAPAAFETALGLEPQETSGLLAASELALLTGDRKKHRRYLRLAQHFGADEGTLNFWAMLREFGEKDQANAGLDEHDRKIAVMDAVIRLNPDDDYAHRVRGDCLRYRGEYDEAVTDFDTALRLNPETAASHLGRGAAYCMKHAFAQVIADFHAAARLKPEEPLTYRFRADAYVAAQQYDLAIADCDTVLKLSPKDPIAYFTRGNAPLFSAELDLALADFNTAVELDPADGHSTYGRGLVRLLLEDEAGAERDSQLARELGYDDQDLESQG